MERKPGSARPRKSTDHQHRQIVKIVKVDPRNTSVDVINYANDQLDVSIGIHTARNRLREAYLLARKPAKKTCVCQTNLNRSKKQWAKVLWSKESKLNLFGSDGLNYIRWPPK